MDNIVPLANNYHGTAIWAHSGLCMRYKLTDTLPLPALFGPWTTVFFRLIEERERVSGLKREEIARTAVLSVAALLPSREATEMHLAFHRMDGRYAAGDFPGRSWRSVLSGPALLSKKAPSITDAACTDCSRLGSTKQGSRGSARHIITNRYFGTTQNKDLLGTDYNSPNTALCVYVGTPPQTPG